MKTLFITRNPVNRGGHVVLTQLVRELIKQGIAAEIIAFKPEGTADFENCEHLFKDLPVRVVSVKKHDDYNYQMMAYVRQAQAELEKNYDHYDRIILDSWFIAMAGALLGHQDDKVFHLVQSDPVFTPTTSAKLWEALSFEMLGHFPMQRILVSSAIHDEFAKRYSHDFSHIDLYVDSAYHNAEFTVKPQEKVRFIASASTFNLVTKGLTELLDSLSTLPKDTFELTLLTAQQIEQSIDKYEFPIDVTSTRTPQETIDIFKKHDVYLNTSQKETFCLALAEAITLGMPAVALDSVGNREYFTGDNYLFARNMSEFTAKLKNAMNVDTQKALHKKAKESMARYTLDNTVKQFRAITSI